MKSEYSDQYFWENHDEELAHIIDDLEIIKNLHDVLVLSNSNEHPNIIDLNKDMKEIWIKNYSLRKTILDWKFPTHRQVTPSIYIYLSWSIFEGYQSQKYQSIFWFYILQSEE